MRLFSAIVQDLRLAVRQARRTPVVSSVALLSLALGIGANVAIFSLVNALILRPLPVADPEHLVVLGRSDARGDGGRASTSFTHPHFEYLRTHQDMFAGLFGVGYARLNLGTGSEARIVPGLYVDSGFLDTLGVAPVLGRTFTAEDDRRGGGPDGPVAILNHGFWERAYGGDRSVIGRTLTLDGHTFTIIGVTPREFFGVRVGLTFDVMIPIGNEPIIRGAEGSFGRPTSWWLSIFARLKPGVSLADTEARLNTIVPS
ncbi:MAG: ABC transporter permease, partial [Vicinamibacterales bacterium]